MRSSVDDNESFKEAIGSLCFYNPPSDPSPNTLERVTVPVGSNSSMQPQESPEENRTRGSEDTSIICFDNPPSNPNTHRQMESTSSMPLQERSEITTMYRT
jgi:hypothetical protein